MTFTVIIPTLNEASVIEKTLRLTGQLGFDEIVVADGGSNDGTNTIVDSLKAGSATPIRLVAAQRGRAKQLNAAAKTSHHDVLVFLHADSHLPFQARQLIDQALADTDVVGGRFDVRFDPPSTWGHVISRFMNLRSRLSRISTGDQAIFVRRQVFDRVGGFPDIPIMEDIEFSARFKRAGPTVALRSPVTTSFRRWERQGPLRTIFLMWCLRFLYWLGVSPSTLSRWYGVIR